MRHFTTLEFWRYFERLRDDIQRLAQKEFALLKGQPAASIITIEKSGQFLGGTHRHSLPRFGKRARGRINLVLDWPPFRIRQIIILTIARHGY